MKAQDLSLTALRDDRSGDSMPPGPDNPPSAKPPVAVTMGDPAGVGPELCLRILTEPACWRSACR